MLAKPIAQKARPLRGRPPTAPFVGGAPPPPMWATPHRLRRGRIDEMDTSWRNPPRGQKTAFLASTSLMSTLATDAERMDAANEHSVDKHATDAPAKDLPNAAEPTDSAPSSASKAQKPKAAKSPQDNAWSSEAHA